MDFGYALNVLNEGGAVRLKHWTPDISLRLQTPDVHSKMTHPYIYVASRFGNVPWVATQVELLSDKWEQSPK